MSVGLYFSPFSYTSLHFSTLFLTPALVCLLYALPYALSSPYYTPYYTPYSSPFRGGLWCGISLHYNINFNGGYMNSLSTLIVQAQQSLNSELDDVQILDRDMGFQLRNVLELAQRITADPTSTEEDHRKVENLLNRRLEISAAWKRIRQQLTSL